MFNLIDTTTRATLGTFATVADALINVHASHGPYVTSCDTFTPDNVTVVVADSGHLFTIEPANNLFDLIAEDEAKALAATRAEIAAEDAAYAALSPEAKAERDRYYAAKYAALPDDDADPFYDEWSDEEDEDEDEDTAS